MHSLSLSLWLPFIFTNNPVYLCVSMFPFSATNEQVVPQDTQVHFVNKTLDWWTSRIWAEIFQFHEACNGVSVIHLPPSELYKAMPDTDATESEIGSHIRLRLNCLSVRAWAISLQKRDSFDTPSEWKSTSHNDKDSVIVETIRHGMEPMFFKSVSTWCVSRRYADRDKPSSGSTSQ